MTDELKKKMMDLAEKSYSDYIGTVNEARDFNIIFSLGFQAAVPLVRAELLEELKSLDKLSEYIPESDKVFFKALALEKQKSAKLLEAVKAWREFADAFHNNKATDWQIHKSNEIWDNVDKALKEYEGSNE